MFSIPATTDSYNIGKDIIDTIMIGALLAPKIIKNKNTKAAVGIDFKKEIKGTKEFLKKELLPAIIPKTKASIKEIENPINKRSRLCTMHLYT